MCTKSPFCISMCAKLWYSIAIILTFGLASTYFWEMRSNMLKIVPENFEALPSKNGLMNTEVLYLSQLMRFPIPKSIYATNMTNTKENCLSDKKITQS